MPKKDKTGDVFPGFTFGGPIWKDHIFGFVGFNPEFNSLERVVTYPVGGVVPAGGPIAFSQNTQTYYTTARVDAAVTSKASPIWLLAISAPEAERRKSAISRLV